MELTITRLALDDRYYSIDFGTHTRFGMERSSLQQWLAERGIDDATIIAVLNMRSDDTMTLQVTDELPQKRRPASPKSPSNA